jgi:hypothetical protein
MHDRLKPGGMIIIEVPNAGSPILGSFNMHIDFTHEIGFTAPSLKEVMMACDFKRVAISPVMDASPFARVFFRAVNYILHTRFTRDAFAEGGLIGIGYK